MRRIVRRRSASAFFPLHKLSAYDSALTYVWSYHGYHGYNGYNWIGICIYDYFDGKLNWGVLFNFPRSVSL